MPSGTCFVTGEFCPIIHVHHVIPRQFGGTDSTVVILSPNIHTAIHAAAKSDKSLDDLLYVYHDNSEACAKIRMLVAAIKNAEKTLDVSQHIVTITLSPEEFNFFKKEAEFFQTSVPNLLKSLIHKFVRGKK